jgi:hypothetical protein
MIICFLGIHINISRLFTFACFITVIVQFKLAHAVNTTSRSTTRINPFFNSSVISTLIKNQTTNNTLICEAEVIDETKYYFSVGYRAFAGALCVPITICAICGNTLVIYVIKHYHSLRITGNIFLASLAVADVGVSTLAMTFYGFQLVKGRWIFGPVSLFKILKNINVLKKLIVFSFNTYICINESKQMLSRNAVVNIKFLFFFMAIKEYIYVV